MDIYELLKNLSSESKAKIIIHFLDCKCGDVCVTNICNLTCLKQANVSKHIIALKKNNILISIKNGREVNYSINPEFKKKWGPIVKSIVEKDETLSKLKCSHE